jgi:hypothetical protein
MVSSNLAREGGPLGGGPRGGNSLRDASQGRQDAGIRDKGPRDQRLDFWRGLCLIDMLLVHLVYNKVQFGDFLENFLGSYTRFAAGGFIFISGLSIGVIFLPRALDVKRRLGTYKALWRRSFYILAVHVFSCLVLISMEILLQERGNFVQAGALLRDIFTLREGGDLLPFYVLMIALSPLVIGVLRHRGGWAVVLPVTIGLFVWGLWHPWAFALAQHENFPPILWQAIFMLGLVFGSFWPSYNALARHWKMLAASAALTLAAVMFVLEYAWMWGMPQLCFGVGFSKVPLSTAEGLRYLSIILSIMFVTDLLWERIQNWPAVSFAQTLGRKSLPVYVLHLWIVVLMGYLSDEFKWMGAWQILFAVASALVLWSFAALLEIRPRATAKKKSYHPAWSIPQSQSGMMGAT